MTLNSPLDVSHVPFIALTQGEGELDVPEHELVVREDGWLAYRAETSFDRCPGMDVLLARTTGSTPSGAVNGAALSPYRQSHCMVERRCQGCGGLAARSPLGLLFVLAATRRDGRPSGKTGLTDMPPSCARCALSHCPALDKQGRHLVWAREAEVSAVYGHVLLPPSAAPGLPISDERLVSLDDEPTLSATVATRFACDLQAVADADEGEIRAMADETARASRAGNTPLTAPRRTEMNSARLGLACDPKGGAMMPVAASSAHAFSAAQRVLARHVVGGMSVEGSAGVHRSLDVIQARLGVLTLRAMCYRLLDRDVVRLPAVRQVTLRLDRDARAVWAALRWDILEPELVPSLAVALGLPESQVAGVLDLLRSRFGTSLHGLIGYGIAHGVLGRGLDVAPPAHTGIAATAPGEGTWDAAPSVRRALALRAGGRTTGACAAAEGVSRATITKRLGEFQSLAKLRTHRALVHAGLLEGVLVRPDRAGKDAAPDVSEAERLVWQHLVLDVANEKLPGELALQTGLSQDLVHQCLNALRGRFGDECATVVEGWRHGVLCDSTPVTQPVPSAADEPARLARPALSPRQHEALSLLTVGGLNIQQAAARMGIAAGSVDGHRHACAIRAGVRSLRSLTHWALTGGLLTPLDAGHRIPGPVTKETATVWGHLALNCPDAFLEKELANTTGLPRHQVHACLKDLRSTGLTDPQLVAAGWHHRILDAASPTRPDAETTRPVRRTETRRLPARAAVAPRTAATTTARNRHGRSLDILPRPYQESPAPDPAWLVSRFARCGQDVDILWTDPHTCRKLLTRIPEERWGPVIAAPQSRMVQLVTEPDPDRPVRRTLLWRFHSKGGRVELPLAAARSGPGPYWAVPPTAPLWQDSDLDVLLTPRSGPGGGR
ncbi:helix-turn-helix transcriptional regulator [Streptomyces sp. NPDC001515]